MSSAGGVGLFAVPIEAARDRLPVQCPSVHNGAAMQTRRIIAVLLFAGGLGLVGIALGLIYMDFKQREGAWVQAHHGGEPEMEAWKVDEHDRQALYFGSAGAAAFGAGLLLAVFELRWFQPRE